MSPDCDILVIGGGINGCGMARDLAGRGWRVTLCEKDDLAAHTSSASTKLIHGGLRYLEHYEFGLVRKALREREVLLRSAPHIIRPLRLVMPHEPAMRPAWMIRTGLFLYDHLARRELLPASRGVRLRSHPAGAALQSKYRRGFVYSDGWVDDARLVVLNAIDARERGATILTRTSVTRAVREAGGWSVSLRGEDGRTRGLRARAIVNAAGPWAAQVLADVVAPLAGQRKPVRRLRLVKGSHIVVPRLFTHDFAYLFQNSDKRITFAIPYEEAFTLIGTTDVEIDGGGLEGVRADDTEIAYLCAQANAYFDRKITPADVVWSYSGVRPLLDDEDDDPSAVTRDYLLERDTDGAPLLSVWGGKITTFRKLAEDGANAMEEMLGAPHRAWTEAAPLAGGDLGAGAVPGAGKDPGRDQGRDRDKRSGTLQEQFARFEARLLGLTPWLPRPVAQRFARNYGSRVWRLLDGATKLADMGAEVAPGLFERELAYLRQEEWARTDDDVLWRRSKLGLTYTAGARARVREWMRAG